MTGERTSHRFSGNRNARSAPSRSGRLLRASPGRLSPACLRLLGDNDPHGNVEHWAGTAKHGQEDQQHPDQGCVNVEVLGQATTYPASLRLVLLRYNMRVYVVTTS
jgi:hypothetical protein